MELDERNLMWPQALGALGSWPTTLVIGVVTLLVGLIVSFHPSTSLNVIAVLVGLLVIISGVFHLTRMFKNAERHRVWMGISGLLLILLGVILVRHLDLTVALIGLTVGLAWIIQGLSALGVGFDGDADGLRGWWIVFGIVSLLGGIFITSFPVKSVTALAVLLGIWFVVQGLFEILDGFLLRHMVKKAQITIVDPPRQVREQQQGLASGGDGKGELPVGGRVFLGVLVLRAVRVDLPGHLDHHADLQAP